MADVQALLGSLPPKSTSIGGINQSPTGVFWRAYVETTAYTTHIKYFNGTGKSFLLYFRTIKKDGSTGKASVLVNICTPDTAKTNSVSAFNCQRIEEVDKGTFDQLKH